MSQAPLDFPRLLSAESTGARFSWKDASRHFDDLGTVHVGIYGFIRDLIPALVMASWWFLQNSASLSASPEEWLSSQFSLLDVALLAVLTLCWREIAGSAMATGSKLVRKQAIGNLIAALCCSILAFMAGCTHTTPTQAMILSVCFSSLQARLACCGLPAPASPIGYF